MTVECNVLFYSEDASFDTMREFKLYVELMLREYLEMYSWDGATINWVAGEVTETLSFKEEV